MGSGRVQLGAWRKPYFDVDLIGQSSVVGWGSYVVRIRTSVVVVRLVRSYVCLVNEEARDTTKVVEVIEKAF